MAPWRYCLGRPRSSVVEPDHQPAGRGARHAGRRGILLGIKQSGVQASQFFAGAALPSIALVLGWRGATAASVILVLVGLLGTAWLVPQPKPGRVRPAVGAGGSYRSTPALIWLAGYGFLVGVVIQGTNVYLPLYSYEALDFSPRAAGFTAGITGIVGVFGRILWGRAAELFRTTRVPLLLLAIAATVAVALLAAAPLLGPLALWFGVVIFAISALASTVVLMVAVLRTVPSEAIGSASGRVMVGLYAGFTVGPITFGTLVDRSSTYLASWSLLIGCSLLTVILAAAWKPSGGRF